MRRRDANGPESLEHRIEVFEGLALPWILLTLLVGAADEVGDVAEEDGGSVKKDEKTRWMSTSFGD